MLVSAIDISTFVLDNIAVVSIHNQVSKCLLPVIAKEVLPNLAKGLCGCFVFSDRYYWHLTKFLQHR